MYLVAAEQLVDADPAQVGHPQVALDRREERRQVAHQQSGRGGLLDQFGDADRRQRRDRHQGGPRAGGLRDHGHVVERTEHRQPADPAQPTVVVQVRDGHQAVPPGGPQRPDHGPAGVSRAEHERRQRVADVVVLVSETQHGSPL